MVVEEEAKHKMERQRQRLEHEEQRARREAEENRWTDQEHMSHSQMLGNSSILCQQNSDAL